MTDDAKNTSFVKWVVDGFFYHNMGIDNSKTDQSFEIKLYKIILAFGLENPQSQINESAEWLGPNINNKKIVLTEFSKSFVNQDKSKQETSHRHSNINFVKWVVEGFRCYRIGVWDMNESSKDKLDEKVKKFNPQLDELPEIFESKIDIDPSDKGNFPVKNPKFDSQIYNLAKDFETKIKKGNFVLMPYPKPED